MSMTLWPLVVVIGIIVLATVGMATLIVVLIRRTENPPPQADPAPPEPDEPGEPGRPD